MDIRPILKGYRRIMEWDVPDVDEKAATELIQQAVEESVAEVEAEQ